MAYFSIDSSDLQKLLKITSPLLSKTFDDANPSVVQFDITKNVSTIRASSDEILSEVEFSCEVFEEGKFAVPGVMFLNIIKSISGQKTELKTQKEGSADILLLSSSHFRCRINTLTPRFPYLEIDKNAHTKFTIESQNLFNMIKQTSCCVDTKTNRANLNSILFHSEEESKGTLKLVTTDGIRLSVASTNINTENIINNILIPKKSCDYLSNALSSHNGDILCIYSSNMIYFKIGNVHLTMRIVDAEFPKYKSVIPTKNNKLLDVKTSNLIKTIKGVIGIASIMPKINFEITSEELNVFCEENGNKASNNLECTFTDSNKMNIRCDATLLLEILSSIDSNMIRFEIAENISPMIIRPIDNEDIRYVFMPVS